MRGFVTIATGDDKYYMMAANLLRSYRKWATDDTPFAIICDRETGDTAGFDTVVVMEQANRSYLDKLLLYCYTPYEETIFIDADSLILSDPAGLWEDFADGDDVSCYGCKLPLDSNQGWFSHDGCGKYKENVQYLVDLHGGIYYLRKSERCQAIFETALDLATHYTEYSFRHFSQPADEPVLAMALAIHQSVPCGKAMRVLFVPSYWGLLSVTVSGDFLVNGKKRVVEVLHFATANTTRFLYRYLADLNIRKTGTALRWLSLKVTTLPAELKAVLWRWGGQFLRRRLSGDTVARIKKLLRK
jgi:hypothetical protein